MIIGITGTIGAGKGTIVEYLEKKGFLHLSVRGYLNSILKKEGKPLTRENMVELANNLREQNSPSYIVEELYKIAKEKNKDCIIESIRTVGEVESLKRKNNFKLISIDAKPRTRFSRIKKRKSTTDKIDYKTFLKQERIEMISKDPGKQNLRRCIKLSDYKILNNGTKRELMKKIKKVLENMEKEKVPETKAEGITNYKRPSWDEYFMEVCRAVAKRATCDRGRSGCVIAKDKQLLVTGYVGSPTGMPHCDEVGHQFKKTIHESGKISNHCVRTVHAEQNAICQAAKLGVSLDGATVYCKMTPCRVCAMLIINAGIKKVVCEKRYHEGDESEEMFKKANVSLEFSDGKLEQYKNM